MGIANAFWCENPTPEYTMLSLLRRATRVRRIHSAPFHDDLVPNDELFNLEDFQHYKEAPDVRAKRLQMGLETEDAEVAAAPRPEALSFAEAAGLAEPMVFVSRLTNPYANLALEDYIYNRMPLPKTGAGNCNRLLFYVNSPCVVIGKNQNPWKEVNLPLLTNLKIPLVRRRSGGGTVVHDLGNVNYLFMTTKERFDRFTFAQMVVGAVNALDFPTKLAVNDRGDIVTQQGGKKVSGSAYKLSRGKSYHHGTMLLHLRLDVLRQLLHRDEKLGVVESSAAVASVKSPVDNINVPSQDFIDAVTRAFKSEFAPKAPDSEFTELLGLQSFVDAYAECRVVTVDDSTALPAEVQTVQKELEDWGWRFGATPKFTHKLSRDGFSVELAVDKKGLLGSVTVTGPAEIQEKFEYLKLVVDRGDEIQYTGSSVAGFVLDDEISEWLGNAIDGTS